MKSSLVFDKGCVWIGSKWFQEIIFCKTRVFGSYGKLNFRKIISVWPKFCSFDSEMVLQFRFTFKPFSSHAQKRERARERKSSDAQKERKKRNREPRNRLRLWRTHSIALRRIEKTHSSNPFDHTQKTHSIKPRKPIRQTQKTYSIAPSQTLIALIAPPARSSHPSTDPPKTDRSRRTPKAIILMLFLLGIENLGFVSFVSFRFWWIWVLSSTQLRRPLPRFVVPIHRT